MKTLYFDCFSGISGDMIIAALLGLGASFEKLEKDIQSLNLNTSITLQKKIVRGINSNDFIIEAKDTQPLRHLSDILKIIDKSGLDPYIQEEATQVFNSLAQAEAEVHGVDIEKIHFHEIGAVDTLIDIVGSFSCLQDLDPSTVISSPLPWARGMLNISHGLYPLPAPATALLLRDIPCYGVDASMELVTPTGAALIKRMAKSFSLLPDGIPEKISYGAGKNVRSDKVPNLLRLIQMTQIQASPEKIPADYICVLDTQIDDMSSEVFTYLYKLFQKDEDVLDFFTSPIYMKKNRPAFLLTVLCKPESLERISGLIMKESSSIGIRYRHQMRICAERKEDTITTPWGRVRIKRIFVEGVERWKPESEDCILIAEIYNIPLLEVYRQIYQLISKEPKT